MIILSVSVIQNQCVNVTVAILTHLLSKLFSQCTNIPGAPISYHISHTCVYHWYTTIHVMMASNWPGTQWPVAVCATLLHDMSDTHTHMCQTCCRLFLGHVWYSPLTHVWYSPLTRAWYPPLTHVWYSPLTCVWYSPLMYVWYCPLTHEWYTLLICVWYSPLTCVSYSPLAHVWYYPLANVWYSPLTCVRYSPITRVWYYLFDLYIHMCKTSFKILAIMCNTLNSLSLGKLMQPTFLSTTIQHIQSTLKP